MYGDSAISSSGDDSIGGLAVEEFHTHRFESSDGINFSFAVDGLVFQVGASRRDSPLLTPLIKMMGFGACDAFQNTVNEWDFVRFGRIGSDERVVAAGFFANQRDKVKITFDAPNYLYVNDITVEVTGGVAPVVIATRRAEGDLSDIVEIVLDRPMPVGETTTFKIDTGLPINCDESNGQIVNCVQIPINEAGSGSCGDGIVTIGIEQCDNGPSNSDTEPDACRTTCTQPICGDNVTDSGEECDGTSDEACPGDPVTPGGLCLPDCTCDIPGIPTLSNWGLLALAVLLLALSRHYFGRSTA